MSSLVFFRVLTLETEVICPGILSAKPERVEKGFILVYYQAQSFFSYIWMYK